MTDRSPESQPHDIAALRRFEFLGDEGILEMPHCDDFDNLDKDIEGLFSVFRGPAVPEDEPDEPQKFLLDILDQRSDDEVDPTALTQLYELARQYPELPWNHCYDIPTLAWARQAGCFIAGESVANAGRIHEQFKAAYYHKDNSWMPAVMSWLKTTKATDKDLFDKVCASARIIAKNNADFPHIQMIIATIQMQIAYDQDLTHLAAVEPEDAGSEMLPPALIEPRMRTPRGLGATKYTEADLLELPIEELLTDPDHPVDPNNLDGAVTPFVPLDGLKYTPREFDARGKTMLNALQLVNVVKKELKYFNLNIGDTHNMVGRINGEALDGHLEELHFVRRIVFNHKGLSFDNHARASVAMYKEYYKLTEENWAEWLHGAEDKLADNDALCRVLDDSIEFAYEGADSRLRRYYMSAAAITLEEIRHYQDINGFIESMENDEQQAMERDRLCGEPGAEPLPKAVIEPNIPIRRGGAMAHEVLSSWPADELLRYPQSKYDIDHPDKNPILEPDDPELIVPVELTDDQKTINRIQRIIAIADKRSGAYDPSDADMPVYYSGRMMQQLTGNLPDRDLIALAHRVRAKIFADHGIEEDHHIATIHRKYGKERTELKPEAWTKLANASRAQAFDDPRDAEQFERELSLLIEIPERDEIVHKLAYITLMQVRRWLQRPR